MHGKTTTLAQDHVVPTQYRSMKETQDLNWNDNFFDQDAQDGIVAVFDFDYEQMANFQFSVAALSQAVTVGGASVYAGMMGGAIGVGVVATAYSLTLSPCCLRNQIEWNVYANHVAVTRD